MRLGKTMIAIRLAIIWHCFNVLVLAPKSVLLAWCDELTLEQISYNLLEKKNKKSLLVQNGWFLTNYENSYILYDDLQKKKFDCIICDESTYIKNCRALRSKNTIKLSSSFRIVLSGNPTPNHELEIYQQLKFLIDEPFDYNNYYTFRMRYFLLYGFKYYLKHNMKNRYNEYLKEHCYFLKRADLGFVCEEIIEKRELCFDTKMKQVYKTVENEMVLEFNNEELERYLFKIQAFTKLRLLTSGFIQHEFIWKDKLNELKILLENDLKDEKVIIICEFTNYEIKNFKNVFKNALYLQSEHDLQKRKYILGEFKNSNKQHLFSNSKCIGHGLTLDFCDTMIFYSLPLGGDYYQTKERTINICKKNILLIYLLVKDSVDEDIFNGLQKKQSMNDIQHAIVKRILYNDNK